MPQTPPVRARMTQPKFNPPSTLEDLDRIIDLYYYEQSPPGREDIACGGAGSYCYFGPSDRAELGGTELAGWTDAFAAHIRQHHAGKEDFRAMFDGRAFRVCRDDSNGELLSIRRLPTTTPVIGDLKMDQPAIRELLLAPWLNDGGLVLFCGLTGQGKTTWASGTVRSRLEKYGGRCVAVEDVSELPLEGGWGRGSCHQIVVDYETTDRLKHGFAGAIRRAYRSLPATRPAILYIGEVRDAETAEEVVKAASNGMLVVTTIHGGDPAAGLMRLISLAETAMGESARLAIGQALRLVVHNSLTLRPDTTGWKRGSFVGTALVSDGPAHPVANLIRQGNYVQVAGVVDGQRMHIDRASKNGTPAVTLLGTIGTRQAAVA